jgi:anti-sigma factor RsiW
MALDHGIRRHPTRYQLVAFAESMLDRRSPVSAAMASHISSCPSCAAEVQAIRMCLEFTASAPVLEPSSGLTGQILRSARQERRVQSPARCRLASLTTALRGAVYAAGLAAVAVMVFGAALNGGSPGASAAAPLPQMAGNHPTPEALQKTAQEVQALAAAVRSDSGEAQTPLERSRRLAVSVMDADIAAAMLALQRNPGCTRATHIVNANLQRQAETLRNLYVERKL